MITILCQTLFDITKTGAKTKRGTGKPEDRHELIQQQQQSNYDTIIQIISLRSQPEDISAIKVVNKSILDTNFGFSYQPTTEDNLVKIWSFTFAVQHNSVFSDGEDELGALYSDCEEVPLITNLTETVILPSFLNRDSDLKNIHFEILNET